MLQVGSASGRTRIVPIGALIVALVLSLLPTAVAEAAAGFVPSYTTQPGSSAGPGYPLSPSPVVNVMNSSTLMPAPNIDVTLTITPGTGTLGANLTCTSNTMVMTDSMGNATFTGCAIDRAGTGYQLRASAQGGGTTDSVTFNVAVGAAAQLVFTALPSSAVTGQPFPTNPTVAIEDSQGDLVPTETATITLALASNPGAGVLSCSGGTQISSSNGYATFTGCSISQPGAGYSLQATATNASPATSLTPVVGPAFTVSGGTAAQLVFTQWPSSASTGQQFPVNPTVAIEDGQGNLIPTETATITLALASNPGAGVLSCSGGNQVFSSGGFATFTGCSISQPGVGYTLLATGMNASPVVSLTPAVSPAFTVGAASQLVFAAIPSSATTGQVFPTNPVVAIEDSQGNVVTSISAAISLAIGSNPGGGVLTCSSGNTVVTVNGIATFTGCSVSAPGAGYTLVATAANTSPVTALTQAVSPAFTVLTLVAPNISLSASSSVIVWRDSVTLDVNFPTSGALRTFTLEISADGSTWNPMATLTTDQTGAAAFTWTPATNFWYRADFPGATDLGAGDSNVVRVVVRQIALLRPTSLGRVKDISRGTSITFTTTVRPIGPNVPQETAIFVLYRWNGSSWVLDSSQRVAVDSSGRASWTWSAGTAGSWYVRSEAVPTPANANSGWGPVERYNVS
ncbi:MAG TPA: hypothetical protein VNF73_17950 [Candidatus Saccharimonadales bacterium]|nr:hypothetical protein [Candidatus Saccharimonadales bacterium]